MRIVSLCPSITKLVFDLGRGADVVGVTRYCVRPADAVEGIEKLGGTKNPNLDRIIALTPDLVLMNREENRHADWERLTSAGIPCLVTYPVSLDETVAAVRSIGEALERKAGAEAIIAGIECARELACGSASARQGPTWAYLIWRKPWMTVNRETYIHALLCEAGGANVFAELKPAYPSVSAERIAAAAPDLVFLSSEPFPFQAKHRAELAAATGLPDQRFHLVDGEKLSWHGSHTEAGLYYALELMKLAAP